MKKLILLALSLGLPLLLNSCLEGEEEIWIHGDASGRLRADFKVPTLAFRELGDPQVYLEVLQKIDDDEDGFAIQKLDFERGFLFSTFSLEATFEDARNLVEISQRAKDRFAEIPGVDQHQLDTIAGKIDFQLQWLHPVFRREIDFGAALPPEVRNSPEILGDSKIRYIMHLPAPVKEHNATAISDDRLTLTWDFRLQDQIDGPMILAFRSSPPIPSWAFWLAGSLVIIAAILLWRRFGKKKNELPPSKAQD